MKRLHVLRNFVARIVPKIFVSNYNFLRLILWTGITNLLRDIYCYLMEPTNSISRSAITKKGTSKKLPARMSRAALIVLSLGFVSFLGGCLAAPRIPYTLAEAQAAQPLGYSDQNIRVWLDGYVPNLKEFPPKLGGRRDTYLALSGGGGNGAYGAGVLNGWTATGKRPTFTAVSGISTGALIAPFAFLGPSYDATLASVYTDGQAESLIQTPNFVEAAFGSSLFGSGRLLDLVSRYVDTTMVGAIGREHRTGRRLYVVTTNLDAKRAVVWNLGAIAASERPDAVDLIQKVLAASASVPLAFSPVLIDAATDGRAFQEMHADGNVTTAVFTLPLAYLTGQGRMQQPGRSIYIVMNTSIEPEFAPVKNDTLDIIGASIETLTTQKTLADLHATYVYARSNRIDFNLTAIDKEASVSGAKSFDAVHMRKLFSIGYEKAASGNIWRKSPPATLSDQALKISMPSLRSRDALDGIRCAEECNKNGQLKVVRAFGGETSSARIF